MLEIADNCTCDVCGEYCKVLVSFEVKVYATIYEIDYVTTTVCPQCVEKMVKMFGEKENQDV